MVARICARNIYLDGMIKDEIKDAPISAGLDSEEQFRISKRKENVDQPMVKLSSLLLEKNCQDKLLITLDLKEEAKMVSDPTPSRLFLTSTIVQFPPMPSPLTWETSLPMRR